MEQTSLDDILGDKEPEKKEIVSETAETTPEKSEKPEKPDVERVKSLRKEARAKEYAAQGRDPDTGQFIAKDEAVKETTPAVTEAPKPEATKPPEQEMTPKEKAAFTAMAEERRKRQEWEKKARELEARLSAPQQTPATPETPKTFWDDPEGFFKSWEEKTLQVSTQTALRTKLQTAEMLARSRYQDFDEKVPVFKEIVESTPGLVQQWLSAPDPAEFAYRTAANHMALKQAGDIDSLRAQIEKETRVKVEAEMREKQAQEASARAKLPGSLSDVKGAAPQQRAVFHGPTPLEDILKR